MPTSARDWTKIAVFCTIFAIGFGAQQFATGVGVPQMLVGVAVSTAIVAFIAIKTNWLSR